jgi:hypothetical protein
LDKETYKALGHLEAKATADPCGMTTRKATARTTAKAVAKTRTTADVAGTVEVEKQISPLRRSR